VHKPPLNKHLKPQDDLVTRPKIIADLAYVICAGKRAFKLQNL